MQEQAEPLSERGVYYGAVYGWSETRWGSGALPKSFQHFEDATQRPMRPRTMGLRPAYQPSEPTRSVRTLMDTFTELRQEMRLVKTDLAEAYGGATLYHVWMALGRRGTPPSLVEGDPRCALERVVRFSAPCTVTPAWGHLDKGLSRLMKQRQERDMGITCGRRSHCVAYARARWLPCFWKTPPPPEQASDMRQSTVQQPQRPSSSEFALDKDAWS